MIVKELKQKLEQYPDDMDVFLDERVSDFTYGLLNSISSKEIQFMEEPGGEPLTCYAAIILSEE